MVESGFDITPESWHDYMEATAPVKNFGKRSRTKYTHLLDQDTTVKTGGFGGLAPVKAGGKSLEGSGCFSCGGPHLRKVCSITPLLVNWSIIYLGHQIVRKMSVVLFFLGLALILHQRHHGTGGQTAILAPGAMATSIEKELTEGRTEATGIDGGMNALAIEVVGMTMDQGNHPHGPDHDLLPEDARLIMVVTEEREGVHGQWIVIVEKSEGV